MADEDKYDLYDKLEALEAENARLTEKLKRIRPQLVRIVSCSCYMTARKIAQGILYKEF